MKKIDFPVSRSAFVSETTETYRPFDNNINGSRAPLYHQKVHHDFKKTYPSHQIALLARHHR